MLDLVRSAKLPTLSLTSSSASETFRQQNKTVPDWSTCILLSSSRASQITFAQLCSLFIMLVIKYVLLVIDLKNVPG
jgi:hypothetical protein